MNITRSNEYWENREKIFKDLKQFTSEDFIVNYKTDEAITVWVFEQKKAFLAYLLNKDNKFFFSKESNVKEFFHSKKPLTLFEWIQYLSLLGEIGKDDLPE
jgi:hypothetical protein